MVLSLNLVHAQPVDVLQDTQRGFLLNLSIHLALNMKKEIATGPSQLESPVDDLLESGVNVHAPWFFEI